MDTIVEYAIAQPRYFEIQLPDSAKILSMKASDSFPQYDLTVQADLDEPKQAWCFCMLSVGDDVPGGAELIAVVDDYFNKNAFLYRVSGRPDFKETVFQIL